MPRRRCVQMIGTPNGVRQCSRFATHYLPGGGVVTCTQHARAYDLPIVRSVAGDDPFAGDAGRQGQTSAG